MITLLVLLQAFFFVFYIYYVIRTVGVQKSISYSWYVVPNKGAFDMFTLGVGIPMMIYGAALQNDLAGLSFVLAGFFMCGLGISIVVQQAKYVEIIHYICTGLTIIFSYLGIWLYFHDLIHLLFGAIGIPLILKIHRNKLWWLEIWIFLCIITKLIQL